MTVVNIRSVPNFRSGFCVQPEQSRPTAGNLSIVSAGSKLFDPFRLDTVNQCLWRRKVDGEEERILLRPKVFAILRYLVDHAGRLVTQDELLGAVWPDTFVQPEVLKRHVFDIRNVLGDDSKRPVYIETLPRRGYQFMAPVRSASPNVISANVFSAGESSAYEHSSSDVLAQTKLVGRDRPLRELRTSLGGALRGQRQIVFVTGELGIGKTTLVDEFQRQAAACTPMRIGRGQCVEGYGGKEPYYPMLEALGELCRGPEGDSVVRILAAQAPTWLVQFPSLVKRQERESLEREIAGATKQRMLREIGVALETIASETPLLLVLEDLHWADPSTVDLISALARGRGTAKLMVIGTFRPVDLALVRHPLRAVAQDLLVHQLCQEFTLEPLTETDIAAYLGGEPTDAKVLDGLAALLYERSEGNPLFMVAALEHMAQRGFVANENGTWTLNVPVEEIDLEVPENLHQMIEARIERLSEEERRALEVASVAGVSFCSAVSATAGDMDVENFETLCEGLSRRRQKVRSADVRRFPDGTASSCYQFAHALYREVLYRRQSPGRRAKLHLHVAERLEALYRQRPAEVAPELAHHFEKGGDCLRARKYLQLAADTAGRRCRQAVEILERSRSEIRALSSTGAFAAQGGF